MDAISRGCVGAPARPLIFFAQPIMLRSKSDQNLLTREWEPFALGNGGWLAPRSAAAPGSRNAQAGMGNALGFG